MNYTICNSVQSPIHNGIPQCLWRLFHLQSGLICYPWLSCFCHYQHPMENWNMHSHRWTSSRLTSDHYCPMTLLMFLTVDGVSLSSFNPDVTMNLWWSDKQWIPSQEKWKPYKRAERPKTTANSSDFEEMKVTVIRSRLTFWLGQLDDMFNVTM